MARKDRQDAARLAVGHLPRFAGMALDLACDESQLRARHDFKDVHRPVALGFLRDDDGARLPQSANVPVDMEHLGLQESRTVQPDREPITTQRREPPLRRSGRECRGRNPSRRLSCRSRTWRGPRGSQVATASCPRRFASRYPRCSRAGLTGSVTVSGTTISSASGFGDDKLLRVGGQGAGSQNRQDRERRLHG